MNSRVVRGAVIGIESNPYFEAAPGGVAVHGDGAAAGDVAGGGADAGGVLPEHGGRCTARPARPAPARRWRLRWPAGSAPASPSAPARPCRNWNVRAGRPHSPSSDRVLLSGFQGRYSRVMVGHGGHGGSWWVDCRHELPYNGDMALLDRISLDPTIRSGRPCIRGTRISVGDILGYLAGGMSEDQLLRDFPQLALDDIRACLAYAAEREQRTTAIPAA